MGREDVPVSPDDGCAAGRRAAGQLQAADADDVPDTIPDTIDDPGAAEVVAIRQERERRRRLRRVVVSQRGEVATVADRLPQRVDTPRDVALIRDRATYDRRATFGIRPISVGRVVAVKNALDISGTIGVRENRGPARLDRGLRQPLDCRRNPSPRMCQQYGPVQIGGVPIVALMLPTIVG